MPISRGALKSLSSSTAMKHPIPVPLRCVLTLFRHPEMEDKVQLYLQAGAQEVWVVWENGIIDYYGKTGKLTHSGYDINVKLPLN